MSEWVSYYRSEGPEEEDEDEDEQQEGTEAVGKGPPPPHGGQPGARRPHGVSGRGAARC